MFISITMCTAICDYDDQTFRHMSEESEKKKNFNINIPLWPVWNQGIVEQAKKNGKFRPQKVDRGMTGADTLLKDN